MTKKNILRFRQDLRLTDNKALYYAAQAGGAVVPVFIFDTDILNRFSSGKARIGFLVDAVLQLDQEIRAQGGQLHVFVGKPTEIIPQLIEQYQIKALYHNASYGLGAAGRDQQIQQYCTQHDIAYHSFDDYLTLAPQRVEQRKVFTPFYKLWRNELQADDTKDYSPESITRKTLANYSGIESHITDLAYEQNIHWPVDAIQQRLTKSYTSYQTDRNIPSLDETTKLSPYLRFGLVSPRQLLRWCGDQLRADGITATIKNNKRQLIKDHPYASIISELARREFWHHIMYYFPQTAKLEFQVKKRFIQRGGKTTRLQAWKEGKTGYPIVDAGMRQLKQENWMHGRVRMIVASFLTKDLLIDRRLGEQHFADWLIDYDRAVNIGNWQWSASVGADPKPLRIFNPILQSQKFDPQCTYILKYIPELAGEPLAAIHDPIKHKLDYHPPIVDHYERSRLAKEVYRQSKAIYEQGQTPSIHGDKR